MAEGLFTKRIKDLNLDNKIYVESCATSSWEVGNSIHEGTKNILDQYEIDSKHMRAKQITNRDFETFDYIIGMDQNNVDTLISMNPNYKYKVYLYLDI
ncbi:MAG: protein-tyrosine-phosphatase, partial [Acholeplasmataceae bacterium]